MGSFMYLGSFPRPDFRLAGQSRDVKVLGDHCNAEAGLTEVQDILYSAEGGQVSGLRVSMSGRLTMNG